MQYRRWWDSDPEFRQMIVNKLDSADPTDSASNTQRSSSQLPAVDIRDGTVYKQIIHNSCLDRSERDTSEDEEVPVGRTLRKRSKRSIKDIGLEQK
ncbi:unnamed protein product [Acanthoscelides obtectus]|uniref:Uncharacterized protein n=1 Tax=Acanthoscelides obtectus TaxID=200917 RepID=A0A9P0KEC3_ACAOB|nr:unnamed protein product [Acanthoscelides obtectus]CAK1667555.1 hypothetical protein AOBTE_LOCUS25906 [Acanthoscelides obtectus]